MALVPATVSASLLAAFSPPNLWPTVAIQFVSAIDTYVLTGTTTGAGSAIVVPPSGSPVTTPYTVTGTIVTTAGLTALTTAANTVFSVANPTWVNVGTTLANAISAYLTASVITTLAVLPFVGGGSGVCNPTATLTVLVATMEALFISPTSTWPTIASTLATTLDTFIKAAVITSTDLGATPPASWTGTTVGTIV